MKHIRIFKKSYHIPLFLFWTICYRYLSTGMSFRSLVHSFRLGRSTVAKIVEEPVDVLWSTLSPIHVKEPIRQSYLLAHLHLSRPLPQKVYVQARNFTAVDMAIFNSDLSTRLALAPPSSADGLHQTLTGLLIQHAPASTRLVSHRPPSPWFSLVGPQLLEAKRERRRAERQWIKSGLTVHRLIFQTANSALNAIVHSAKTAYYNTNILACSTSKQLHNITNTLLGKSESSPLPFTVHPSHLPRAFADFFANKIATIRHSLDIDSTSSPTCNDPQFLGQPLAAFHPVSGATARDIIRRSSIKTCELDLSSFLLQSVS